MQVAGSGRVPEMLSRVMPLVTMGLLAILSTYIGLWIVVQEGENPARGWPIHVPFVVEGIAFVLVGVIAAAGVARAVVRGRGLSRTLVAGFVLANVAIPFVGLLFRYFSGR